MDGPVERREEEVTVLGPVDAGALEPSPIPGAEVAAGVEVEVDLIGAVGFLSQVEKKSSPDSVAAGVPASRVSSRPSMWIPEG